MKKFIIPIFIASLIYISCNICSISYCDEVRSKNDIISNYCHNELTTLSSRIFLLSKTIITSDLPTLETKKDEYSKDIDFIISDINYLISLIQNQYTKYKKDTYILNGLYSINLILNEFRFSLLQLYEYINTDSTDINYNNLETFFVINSEANRKLNAAKNVLHK